MPPGRGYKKRKKNTSNDDFDDAMKGRDAFGKPIKKPKDKDKDKKKKN